MNKFWKVTALKPDWSQVFLFTESSDDLVQKDLKLPAPNSLIHRGRPAISPSNKPSALHNHKDFAMGAFLVHCNFRSIRFDGLEEVEFSPNSKPINRVGGLPSDKPEYLASIWEEPIKHSQ